MTPPWSALTVLSMSTPRTVSVTARPTQPPPGIDIESRDTEYGRHALKGQSIMLQTTTAAENWRGSTLRHRLRELAVRNTPRPGYGGALTWPSQVVTPTSPWQVVTPTWRDHEVWHHNIMCPRDYYILILILFYSILILKLNIYNSAIFSKFYL